MTFDAIVIGAGQAGPSLAVRLATAGMKVALVERKYFGGTCVNTGCQPTKTLVASARVAHLARRAADFGVVIEGSIRVEWPLAKARADAIVQESRVGIERSLEGCTVVRGHARFVGKDRVRVGDDVLVAPRIFINVGGRANIPDLPGVGEVPYLTNSSLLALPRLPEHLVIVGGGYVGLEFAQMLRRFGTAVTVVEMGSRLIGREDEDVSTCIRDTLAGEGVQVRVQAKCIRLAPHARGVSVGVDCQEGEPSIVGSHVLLAVGRRANTDDLGLVDAGIEVDDRGFIRVNDQLATNVPGVWALGECNGGGAFTHMAYNDFEIIAANLLDRAERKRSDRIPGYAVFVDPPLGRVGLTEAEARQRGRPLLVSKRPMTRVSRAVEKGETRGFMKVVADAETRKILGAAILGTGGDEAIHGIIDVMNAGLTYDVLQRAVPIHPTVSELIPTLLADLAPVAR